MAGKVLIVDMAGDDILPVWRTVVEFANNGISKNWTLIGGLMVDVHARRAGVFMPRPTVDVDLLVDYATTRESLNDARFALHQIGFELRGDGKYAYRFEHHDGRKIDLMVADHLPSRMTPRLGGRPAFPVSSGEQAIRRRDTYTLKFKCGTEVQLGVPDETGALVAKGAAWLVDSRDRGRHLDDGAVLFAAIGDASKLDYPGMSKNDRKRILALANKLLDSSNSSWVEMASADRVRGNLNAILVRQAILNP